MKRIYSRRKHMGGVRKFKECGGEDRRV